MKVRAVGVATIGAQRLGGKRGAVILTLLPELLRSSDELRLILYGAVIIIIVKFAPFGLLGSKIAQRSQPRA